MIMSFGIGLFLVKEGGDRIDTGAERISKRTII
jgi:hypothetical protein